MNVQCRFYVSMPALTGDFSVICLYTYKCLDFNFLYESASSLTRLLLLTHFIQSVFNVKGVLHAVATF